MTGATNLARVLIVRRNLGTLPFGRDLVTIPATSIALAMASDWLIARWQLPGEWHAVVSCSCFAVAYVAAAWLCLLTPAERTDARNTVAMIAPALIGRSTIAGR